MRIVLLVAGGLSICSAVTWAQDQAMRFAANGANAQRALVVRIPSSFTGHGLAALRDNELIETESGQRVSVAIVRRDVHAIRDVIAAAKARSPSESDHLIVEPLPPGPCSELSVGESITDVLDRPANAVLCLADRRMTVAQVRADFAYAVRRQSAFGIVAWRRNDPAGPSIVLRDRAELLARLPSAADGTIFESPSGVRATAAQLRSKVNLRLPARGALGPENGIVNGGLAAALLAWQPLLRACADDNVGACVDAIANSSLAQKDELPENLDQLAELAVDVGNGDMGRFYEDYDWSDDTGAGACEVVDLFYANACDDLRTALSVFSGAAGLLTSDVYPASPELARGGGVGGHFAVQCFDGTLLPYPQPNNACDPSPCPAGEAKLEGRCQACPYTGGENGVRGAAHNGLSCRASR
jgi:hypothetical protein